MFERRRKKTLTKLKTLPKNENEVSFVNGTKKKSSAISFHYNEYIHTAESLTKSKNVKKREREKTKCEITQRNILIMLLRIFYDIMMYCVELVKTEPIKCFYLLLLVRK